MHYHMPYISLDLWIDWLVLIALLAIFWLSNGGQDLGICGGTCVGTAQGHNFEA